MNIVKIQKFWATLTVWLKIEIFDHSWPVKDEIWQNQKPVLVKIWQNPIILSSVENLPQNWDFYITLDQRRSKFGKIHWIFGSKLRFLTTPDLWKMKFGKIQKFWVAFKISLKILIFDHSGFAKDEIWKTQQFWVTIKIWLKIEIFDHSWPVKDEIWQNQKLWGAL